MRKDKLYLLTFLSITVIYTAIASIALHYFIKTSTYELLETHLEFSKNEASTFATLIGHQLEDDSSKEELKAQIQNSLERTDLAIGFLSIYDWSGRVVCHPDIKKVGEPSNSSQSFVSSVTDNLDPESFYEKLHERQKVNNEITSNEIGANAEVIHLYPVENSDWIVASHTNITALSARLGKTKNRFYTIFLVMGLIVILSYVLIVRLLGSAYEKRLELKNQELENEVVNLSKLNRAIGDYQSKVSEKSINDNSGSKNTLKDNPSKKRILTYIRNELLPIPIEEIAHIYTEHSITYIICEDGRRSTASQSLDELFSQIDNSMFFRANRQFIIAISSIDKIVKYGNNQLKIIVNPNSEVDIIISKNKASEFKQWLNL